MRLQDVKVGDVVEILAESGSVQGQDTVSETCEAVYPDNSREPYVRLKASGWWHPDRLRLLQPPIGTSIKTNTERLAATEAIRYAQQLERSLATAKSEAETKIKDLQSQIVSLEKQVVALRAEVQKVGKQLQQGTRFALLELD
jgi:hypothetical protein